MSEPHAQFAGDELTPVSGTSDSAAMARGEPGLPARFTWRGREYRVAAVLSKWKTSGPCKTGGGEQYLRRHWYKLAAEPCEPRPEADAVTLTVYCERQARGARAAKARWFVYTVGPGVSDAGGQPHG
jgi:hypothetical protein